MQQKDKIVFRPFSLLINTVSSNQPRAIIETTSKDVKPQYKNSVLCSFFPKLNEEDSEEVMCELIFLIDRSGR